jgi:hypothetical protein
MCVKKNQPAAPAEQAVRRRWIPGCFISSRMNLALMMRTVRRRTFRLYSPAALPAH